MMELMKSKFASMSKDELSLTARSANDNLAMGFMSSGNMQLMIAGNFVLQSCLRLGFCTRKLSEKQQWLMKELYRLSEETRNQQSAAAVEAITETDYQLIEKLAGSNRQISEAMFNLIMCAAYADGGLKKEVEDKIDPIFGMLFLALFADSGLESVPAPPSQRPRVTGMEARVLDYMLKQKTMLPLNEIAKAFPGETETAIKKALDGLCEKELVYWYSNVILEPYGVEVDREDVEIVLSDKKPTTAKKTETPEEKAKREKAEAERQAREAAEKAAIEEKKRQAEKEKQDYEKAIAQWKKNTQTAEENRKNELERRKNSKEKELTAKADRVFASARSTAEKARVNAEKKKQKAANTLASLGAFKFSEKKEQKKLIAEAEMEIAKASQKIDDAKKAHTQSLAEINKQLESFVAAQKTDIENRFPLPKEPQKPASVLRGENEERESQKSNAINEKSGIINALEYGKWYRCAEIKALVPALAKGEGTLQTARLCNDLVSEGLLQKTIDKKVIYFALAD